VGRLGLILYTEAKLPCFSEMLEDDHEMRRI
jgi:hypothetical protein